MYTADVLPERISIRQNHATHLALLFHFPVHNHVPPHFVDAGKHLGTLRAPEIAALFVDLLYVLDHVAVLRESLGAVNARVFLDLQMNTPNVPVQPRLRRKAGRARLALQKYLRM